MNEPRKELGRSRGWAAVARGCLMVWALACVLSLPAAAVEEVPTWRCLFFLGFHPKEGQGAPNPESAVGQKAIEHFLETFWEGWFKEYTYWRTDPVTGLGVHGRWMDCRAQYGYEPLPWPSGPQGGVSPAAWVNLGGGAHTVPDYRGQCNLEVDGMGELYEMYDGIDEDTGIDFKQPLMDLFWTPGERFTDTMGAPNSEREGSTRPDGKYSRILRPEDRWTANTRDKVNPGYGVTFNASWNSCLGGEFFVDWDEQTELPGLVDCDGSESGRVMIVVGADMTIRNPTNGMVQQIRTNFVYFLTEFDFLKKGVVPVVLTNVGDLVHVYDWTDTEPPGGMPSFTNGLGADIDIPTNQVLEYMNVEDRPLVQQVGEVSGLWRWQLADGTFVGITNYFQAGIQKVMLPTYKVYQAGMLWGEKGDVVRGVGTDYGGFADAIPAPVHNPYKNAIRGPEWSEGKPAEKNEDFITWWRWIDPACTPPRGAWTVFLAGVPGVGSLPRGEDPPPDGVGIISWGEYTNYIRNNYPGDCEALIARTGDDDYDGADGYAGPSEANVILPGPLLDKTGLSPAICILGRYYDTGWDFYNQYGQNWLGWWTNTFGGTSCPPWIGMAPMAEPWVPWEVEDDEVRVSVAGENLGRADPNQSVYVGTFASTSIAPESVFIYVGELCIMDRGGVLYSPSSTNITGTIDYATGQYYLRIGDATNLLGSTELMLVNYMTETYVGEMDGMKTSQVVWCDAAQLKDSNFEPEEPVLLKTYADFTYPPEESTWGYAAPKEFVDLPSSMYHRYQRGMMNNGSMWTGGDKRFGEELSPWSTRIYGMDRGKNKASDRRIPGSEDDVLPAAGPLAYNINSSHGRDIGSQTAIEFMTWRTDGTFFTGPTNTMGTRGPLGTVRNQNDHRDLDLDGMVDGGETIPPHSQNYQADADPATPNNGMDDWAEFGWERWMEDMVEVWDDVEDFGEVQTRSGVSPTQADVVVVAPVGPFSFVFTNNTPATSNLYLNDLTGIQIAWHKVEMTGPRAYFDPRYDFLWFDSLSNLVYDLEPVLNRSNEGDLTNRQVQTGAFVDTMFYDMDGNGLLSIPSDFMWVDSNGDGVWRSEVVLCDRSQLLENGVVGALLTNMFLSATNYWQDVNGDGLMDWADNYWLEHLGTTTNPGALYCAVDSSDVILHVGTSAAFSNGVVGVVLSAEVRYVDASVGVAGMYDAGDSVWIDNFPVNGLYDSEPMVQVPYGLEWTSQYNTNNRAAVDYFGTFGTNVVWVDRDGSATYEFKSDYAWLDYDDDGAYTVEELIRDGYDDLLAHGATGVRVLNLGWVDLPTVDTNTGLSVAADGRFTPYRTDSDGCATESEGDALWIDNGLPVNDRRFRTGQRFNIPMLGGGLMAPGSSGPAIAHSGNSFFVMTRDGCGIGGYNQVLPVAPEVAGPMLHEFCHDIYSWPDLYDYDVSDPEPNDVGLSVGAYDLMSMDRRVHGLPYLKFMIGAAIPQSLNTILKRDGGVQTLLMYPIERHEDQYYCFFNERGTESWTIYYQDGGSPYSGVGGRGVSITKTDGGDRAVLDNRQGRFQGGRPLQQRTNPRFTWNYLSAGGGCLQSDEIDSWGSPVSGNRMFTADTVPPARWWNGEDSGLRILNVEVPDVSRPWEPARVTIEWVTVAQSVSWQKITDGADTDGDGIPDAWELHWFEDYGPEGEDPLTQASRNGDWDGDGLSDFGEWKAGLNPKWSWSWTNWSTNCLSDAAADMDGDGLSNAEEFEYYGSDMTNPDSDDDGISDGDEVNYTILKEGNVRLSSPTDSRSPAVNRSLRLDGQELTVPEWQRPLNAETRFSLTNWTIECWVNVDTTNQTGRFITRSTAQMATNFVLGVRDGKPYIGFTTEGFLGVEALSSMRLASNTWIHLTGVWASDRAQLELYRDNVLDTAVTFFGRPATGRPTTIMGEIVQGYTTIGGGIGGYLDEVRVWGRGLTEAEVKAAYNKTVNTPWFFGSLTATNVVPSRTASVGLEVLAVGVAGQTTYSGTLSNGNVNAGTLLIAAGQSLVFVDDGARNLVGSDMVSMGTVAYDSGNWTVTIDGGSELADGVVIAGQYQYTVPQQVVPTNIDVRLPNSVENDGYLVANFRFDDSRNLSVTNSRRAWWMGDVPSFVTYGAEDSVHPMNWRYAITNAALMSTNRAAPVIGTTSLYYLPIDDLNEDGIADWWQKLYWPEFSWSAGPTAKWSAESDPDGDGVKNFHEFVGNTHPKNSDGDANGISDYNEDYDNDGVLNGLEWGLYNTDAWLADTDDDGISDFDEIYGTEPSSPSSSLSPLKQNAVIFTGAPNSYVEMPYDSRFQMREWTLEAWVRPSSNAGACLLISREVEPGITNYFLGLDETLHPRAGFGTNVVVGPAVVASGASTNWTHLSATYKASGNKLTLLVNGVEATNRLCAEDPTVSGVGPFVQRIGEGYIGFMDEVRLWAYPRSAADIRNLSGSILAGDEYMLACYYRFDDGTSAAGGTSGRSGWTYGQIEDFHATYVNDWYREWKNAGTIMGSVAFTNVSDDSPIGVQLDDGDGDGLPDWWERIYGLSTTNATGVNGPNGDFDGDGLSNLTEYKAGTPPSVADEDGDGRTDYYEDSDHDGIVNGDEQDKYGTDPSLQDSDDDGVNDLPEIYALTVKADGRRVTSPSYSRSPIVQRSAAFTNNTVLSRDPAYSGAESRYNLREWTVECWVMPTNQAQTGVLVNRETDLGYTNFCLRLTNNVPMVQMTTMGGNAYRAGANLAIPVNVWTHLAGVWDPDNDSLTLYVNGVSFQSQMVLEECALGRGHVVIGGGFAGYLDDLRIWNAARTQSEIADGMNKFGVGVKVRSGLGGSNTYQFVTTPATRDAAAAAAAAAGGHLVYINDAAEQQFILNLIGPNNSTWLGASDSVAEGTWLWDDGTPVEYSDWAVWSYGGLNYSEPDDASVGGQDVAAMWSTNLQVAGGVTNVVGTWYDVLANAVGMYVIEFEGGVTGAEETAETELFSPELAAWFPFDDGGVTAEDFVHPRQASYALANVGMDTNVFVDLVGEIDADLDGIPDWWEGVFYAGDTTPTNDTDSDLMNDLYEYYCDLNPRAADTDNNGKSDSIEDYDRDGLLNRDEQLLGADPRLSDTDDDGVPDGVEKRWSSVLDTDPMVSLKPAVDRSLRFGGATNDFLRMPLETRFALANWTVEAKIRTRMNWTNAPGVIYVQKGPGVSNTNRGAVLVERRVGSQVYSSGSNSWMNTADNYILAIDKYGRPMAGFGSMWVVSPTPLPNNGTWQTISATYDETAGSLKIYVNGALKATEIGAEKPSVGGTGPVTQRAGSGFLGEMDEIRIWSKSLTVSNLQANLNRALNGDEAGLVSYYRCDDGTSYQPGLHATSDHGTWAQGQVQDMVSAYAKDWNTRWYRSGTLQGNVQFTRIVPHVVSVTSTNLDATYWPGDVLDITVTFSEPVTVGAPYIQLETGFTDQYAWYEAGNGSTNIRFKYTLQSNDWNLDLDYVSPTAMSDNGVPIRNSTGGVVNLTMPIPGAVGSLSWNKNLFVDPPRPTVFVNGMTTKWLYEHFLQIRGVDPNADADGDGMSNFAEYRAGTAPEQKSSALAMRAMDVAGSSVAQVTLTWAATPGKAYRLQYKDSLLTPWVSWKVVVADAERMTVVDDGSLTGSVPKMRYYRVVLED